METTIKLGLVNRALSLSQEIEAFVENISFFQKEGFGFEDLKGVRLKFQKDHQKTFVRLKLEVDRLIPLSEGMLKKLLLKKQEDLVKTFEPFDKWVNHLISAEEIFNGTRSDWNCICFLLAHRVSIKELIYHMKREGLNQGGFTSVQTRLNQMLEQVNHAIEKLRKK